MLSEKKISKKLKKKNKPNWSENESTQRIGTNISKSDLF